MGVKTKRKINWATIDANTNKKSQNITIIIIIVIIIVVTYGIR